MVVMVAVMVVSWWWCYCVLCGSAAALENCRCVLGDYWGRGGRSV